MFPMLPSLAVLLLASGQPCLPPGDGASPAPRDTPGPVAHAMTPSASLSSFAERLLAWVVAHTGYAAVPLPPLREASDVALKSRCFPAFPPHLVPRVMAAYDAGEGAIYLSDRLDMTRRIDRSYLLHELVHHVQNAHRAIHEARCKGKLEGEALRLQQAWLGEQGVEAPLEALGLDARTLHILESCP